jgi:D-lactate dehydrogenase (quinone)
MSTNPENFIQIVKDQIGSAAILTDLADICVYSHDTSDLQSLPSIVVFATEIPQIQTIVKLCRQYHVPLTVRGAGTATTGAATPIEGGLVLCLERMNRLIKMDALNRVMVVEAGMTNQAVQDLAGKEGFFWPPDPGSAATCTVGGNLACNAAGPHAVKYGASRDNTLGLKVITGEGELLQTGTYTTKGACGYDFTRLMIGSEGTLGIIVEATLKLTPLPEAKTTLLASYDSMTAACEAVSQIMAQPVTPAALEFMDEQSLALLNQQTKLNFPAHTKALLTIEVDGTLQGLEANCKAIEQAAKHAGLLECQTAKDPAASAKLWEARKALSLTLKTIAPKKINEDIVVPVSTMPDFIERMQALAEQYQIVIVNFGHAGNGNIHVNLMVNPENPGELERADSCLKEIFDYVLSLNGTLSGEHGIGLMKKPFMEQAVGSAQLRLMQKVKQQFDPDGILNPGKIF